MRKIVLIYFVVFSLAAVVPLIARAYDVPNIWPTGYWATGGLISCTGNYLTGAHPCRSLCDLIQTAINIIYFGMTIAIFVLVPIFFAVGAIMIMVAGAKPDMLETGKKTLTGAVIGLVVVLCSYLIINTFITVLGITGIGGFNGGACNPPTNFAAPEGPMGLVANSAASFAMRALPLSGVALAQTQIQISTSIPATNDQGSSPGGVVANFYQFALMISGILALGAVVYGGIKYVASAGNPSAQHEGREWIQSALLGLLLLAGAYLILSVVNPDLLKLDMLNKLNLETVSIAGGGGGGGTCSAAPSGPCSVAQLQSTCLGSNAQAASQICMAESSGNPTNGGDLSTSGQPVSIGLFQINLSANMIDGLNCPAAFDHPWHPGNPSTIKTDPASQTLYTACVQMAQNLAANIAAACTLSSNGTNWGQWSTASACGL